MGRSSGRVVLVGLILATTSVTTSSAVADAKCGGQFAERLECLAGRAGLQNGQEVLTRIDARLELPAPGRGGKRDLRLDSHMPALAKGAFRVEVTGERETGAGGTVLLVLAEHRRLSPDSVITPLDEDTVEQLRKAGACREANAKKLCELVGERGRGQVIHGKNLIGAHFAETFTEPAADDSSSPWLWPLALSSLLVLLTFLLVLAVFRPPAVVDTALFDPHPSEYPAPPRPSDHPHAPARPPSPPKSRPRVGRAVAPTGPRRRAVVRTVLHPQGYVEVDHCLHRAVWADPDTVPPAPGDLVHITDPTEREPDVLLAFPPGNGRRTTGDEHAQ